MNYKVKLFALALSFPLVFSCNYQSSSSNSDLERSSGAEDAVLIDGPQSEVQSPYKEAEQALKERGYDVTQGPNEVDATTNALRQFQKEKGLPITGALDPETRRALGIDNDRQPTSVDEVESNRSTEKE